MGSTPPRDSLDQTLILTPEGMVSPGARLDGPLGLSTTGASRFDAVLRNLSQADNPLLAASSDLIALLCAIPRMEELGQASITRAEIARAIIELKYRVVQLDYPPSVAEHLCLLFGIVIDEFVLTSAWGQKSAWENLTLVADLFGFRDGGDRFYDISERVLLQPRALRHLAELLYIFLKLGYRGRYPKGDDFARDRLIQRLESLIETDQKVPPSVPFGRLSQTVSPPRRTLSALTRTALVLLISIGLVLVHGLVQVQKERETRALLKAQHEQITKTERKVFIYSSTTGLTTVRLINE